MELTSYEHKLLTKIFTFNESIKTQVLLYCSRVYLRHPESIMDADQAKYYAAMERFLNAEVFEFIAEDKSIVAIRDPEKARDLVQAYRNRHRGLHYTK